MFKRGWLNRGRIRSDEGFEVTLIGRSKVRYEEAGRSVDVGGELLTDGFALEPATLSSWNDGTPVEEARKQEIIGRIIAALRSQGMTVDVA
ncbi:MAG: hypothetical protein ACR2JB_18775 [Bryobacteraceae bacterium]